MNLVEFVTAFGFLGMLAVFLIKLLNVMNGSRYYKLDKSIVLFVFATVSYFAVMLGNYATLTIYTAALLKFSALILLVIFILTFAEVLQHLPNTLVRQPRRARMR